MTDSETGIPQESPQITSASASASTPSPSGMTPKNMEILATVLQYATVDISDVNFDVVAQKLGYKNAETAKKRFQQVKKQISEAAVTENSGSGGIKNEGLKEAEAGGNGNGNGKKGGRKRKGKEEGEKKKGGRKKGKVEVKEEGVEDKEGEGKVVKAEGDKENEE